MYMRLQTFACPKFVICPTTLRWWRMLKKWISTVPTSLWMYVLYHSFDPVHTHGLSPSMDLIRCYFLIIDCHCRHDFPTWSVFFMVIVSVVSSTTTFITIGYKQNWRRVQSGCIGHELWILSSAHSWAQIQYPHMDIGLQERQVLVLSTITHLTDTLSFSTNFPIVCIYPSYISLSSLLLLITWPLMFCILLYDQWFWW